jgi:hypothetical protein
MYGLLWGVRSFETRVCNCVVYLQLLPRLKAHSSTRNRRTLRAVFECDIKKTATKIKLAHIIARVMFILIWKFWYFLSPSLEPPERRPPVTAAT